MLLLPHGKINQGLNASGKADAGRKAWRERRDQGKSSVLQHKKELNPVGEEQQ